MRRGKKKAGRIYFISRHYLQLWAFVSLFHPFVFSKCSTADGCSFLTGGERVLCFTFDVFIAFKKIGISCFANVLGSRLRNMLGNKGVWGNMERQGKEASGIVDLKSANAYKAQGTCCIITPCPL